ncbi:MAG TPA: protein-glutamate O-methyltransferase CheR [Polyangiaceae bacterium]|nr:protein-glutamate O-methyltransferase CheR [Polyangiaceae bacterium]
MPPSSLDVLRSWVRTHFGITFTQDRIALFRSQVETLCRDIGISVDTMLLKVSCGDREVTQRLAEAVSTNYTYFFREDSAFTLLRNTVLPKIQGPVRIWSAAASSGDEAYSIAITCAESLGTAAFERVRVLGTDISARQLRIAEDGVYSLQHLDSLNPERRKLWFTPAGLGQFKLQPELRKMCLFRRMNLTAMPWPFTQRFHAIFLRNVLYYFEPEQGRAILEACYDACEPGGWLFTSVTEPLIAQNTRWSSVGVGVYARRG